MFGVFIEALASPASLEERETVLCFVELQEIRLAPRKIRKAPVEVRLFGLPTQFASQKPCNVKEAFARSRISRDLVPLRERSKRLTSSQSCLDGVKPEKI